MARSVDLPENIFYICLLPSSSLNPSYSISTQHPVESFKTINQLILFQCFILYPSIKQNKMQNFFLAYLFHLSSNTLPFNQVEDKYGEGNFSTPTFHLLKHRKCVYILKSLHCYTSYSEYSLPPSLYEQFLMAI